MNLGKPVMVEYPRLGVYSIGYIVNEKTTHFSEKVGKRVFLCISPHDAESDIGKLIYVPEDQIIQLEISSEDLMKLIVSAGFVGPDEATIPKAQ